MLPEQPDEAAADFPRAVIIVLRDDHGAVALADRDQMNGGAKPPRAMNAVTSLAKRC